MTWGHPQVPSPQEELPAEDMEQEELEDLEDMELEELDELEEMDPWQFFERCSAAWFESPSESFGRFLSWDGKFRGEGF